MVTVSHKSMTCGNNEAGTCSDDLVRQLGDLRALYRIATRISATLDMNEMLNSALSEIVHQMQGDAGAIFFLDRSRSLLRLKAKAGRSRGIFRHINTVALDPGDLARIFAWKGLHMDNLKAANLGLAQKQTGTSASAYALSPVVGRREVEGLTIISGTTPFDDRQIELLGNACSHIAAGIENIRLYEKVTSLSTTDELTGLFNRRHFNEVLQGEVERAKRYGTIFSLALLDMDGFKEHNDMFGHSSGDTLLASFGAIIRASLRKTDFGFRHGGDEFALVLPSTPSDHASRVVGRLRTKWEQRQKTASGSPGITVGFSSGVVEFPTDSSTQEGILVMAAEGLYQNKQQAARKPNIDGCLSMAGANGRGPSFALPAGLESIEARR